MQKQYYRKSNPQNEILYNIKGNRNERKSSMRRHENERHNGDGIYDDSMTVFEKKKKNIHGNKKITNYKIDKILSKLKM